MCKSSIRKKYIYILWNYRLSLEISTFANIKKLLLKKIFLVQRTSYSSVHTRLAARPSCRYTAPVLIGVGSRSSVLIAVGTIVCVNGFGALTLVRSLITMRHIHISGSHQSGSRTTEISASYVNYCRIRQLGYDVPLSITIFDLSQIYNVKLHYK